MKTTRKELEDKVDEMALQELGKGKSHPEDCMPNVKNALSILIGGWRMIDESEKVDNVSA